MLLATIVNGPADVILLDEPTNFLDFDGLDVVEEALRALDGALVVVTHDAVLPKSIACDRHLVLADGRLHGANSNQVWRARRTRLRPDRSTRARPAGPADRMDVVGGALRTIGRHEPY